MLEQHFQSLKEDLEKIRRHEKESSELWSAVLVTSGKTPSAD
jgi:hypothetical protein